MQTVYAIHTTFALVEPLKPLFRELLPAVRIVNVVDDGLLAEARAAGGLTPAVTRRLVGYGILAQASGADAILNCCSSVGEAADLLARTVDIPVVKIDDAMAQRAVELGPRIAVIGTVATTLDPTRRLIERKGGTGVRTYLVDGAYDALMAGDGDAHDRMVMAEIQRAAGENDVVALAQGSMARLLPRLPELSAPVLASPRLGVEALAKALATR